MMILTQSPLEQLFEMIPSELQAVYIKLKDLNLDPQIVHTGGDVWCLSFNTDRHIISVFLDCNQEAVYAVEVEQYKYDDAYCTDFLCSKLFDTEDDCCNYVRGFVAVDTALAILQEMI